MIDNEATIETITGNFIGNTVYIPSSDSSTASGGTIYNRQSIRNITGDFIINATVAKAKEDNFSTNARLNIWAHGGAIYSEHTITSVTGDFIGNSVKAVTNDYAYAYAIARGGAILNDGTIGSITGDYHRQLHRQLCLFQWRGPWWGDF